METFGTRLRRARLAAKLSQLELGARAGISQKTISKIERGDQSGSASTASLARALHVDPVWLETGKAFSPPLVLHAHEPALLGDYVVEPADPALRVPVVGTAQAGDDGYWEELQYPVGHGDGFVKYQWADPNAYALRVKGDSMRPRIRPGEFIVAEPNRQINPGDEVLVKTTDGRCMVKILAFRRDGTVELLSINDDYKPITLSRDEIEFMHRVGGIVQESMYYRG